MTRFTSLTSHSAPPCSLNSHLLHHLEVTPALTSHYLKENYPLTYHPSSSSSSSSFSFSFSFTSFPEVCGRRGGGDKGEKGGKVRICSDTFPLLLSCSQQVCSVVRYEPIFFRGCLAYQPRASYVSDKLCMCLYAYVSMCVCVCVRFVFVEVYIQ